MNTIPHEMLLHEDVLSVVRKAAKLRGVTVEDLLSPTRKQEIITARFLAIYISRNSFNYGTKRLAKMFGYTRHGAILHACKKIEAWKERNIKVRQMVKQLEDLTLYETMKLPSRFQLTKT